MIVPLETVQPWTWKSGEHGRGGVPPAPQANFSPTRVSHEVMGSVVRFTLGCNPGVAYAPMMPKDSTAHMRRTIERLGPERSGGLFTHDGWPYPW